MLKINNKYNVIVRESQIPVRYGLEYIFNDGRKVLDLDTYDSATEAESIVMRRFYKLQSDGVIKVDVFSVNSELESSPHPVPRAYVSSIDFKDYQ